jgi:NADH-quinone oxidoreductase subunit C
MPVPALTASDITARLRARLGRDLLEASDDLDQAWVRVSEGRYREVVQTLRDDDEFACDFLDFVSAVDRGEGVFDVVAQVWSTTHRHGVRVKVTGEGDPPTAPTISDIYAGANWHERETWELFGIVFQGHPQLVKLLLPEQFEGYPLRKDFLLMSRHAKPWPGAEEGEESPEDEG